MKKLVVLVLVAALVAFVAVSVTKAAEPNDANKPAAPKANISVRLAAEPNEANKPAKEPSAPKANISINLSKEGCPSTPDSNKPKDSNAPKANIVLRLAVEPNTSDANKPKEPAAPKANISINLSEGCKNAPDSNKPKDSNAPKANIVLRLAVEPNTSDANKPKEPAAPKANISIRLAAEANEANKPAKEPAAPKANTVLRLAVEPNAPVQKDGPVTVRGRVLVTKDANGVITSVKLDSRRSGITSIVLDAKGKELAEKMANKPVEIMGVQKTKGSEKWLTVEKFTELQRQPRTPGDANKPRKPQAPGNQK
jgi:hypothetical protein